MASLGDPIGVVTVGIWARYAGVRRDLVRHSLDSFRAVERRLSPRLSSPPSGFVGRPQFSRAIVSEPLIALTFDDGPDPENTPPLLDILANRNVLASFYLIGEQVSRHPDIARMTADRGHEIGNHTWSHRFLTLQSTRSIEIELERAHVAIEAAIGVPPTDLRPPYGAITPALTRWVDHRFGYRTIVWSIDAADWEEPDADTITNRLVAGAHPGAVALLHDTHATTVDAVATTVDRLLGEGYRFCTVGEMIRVSSSLR